MTSPSDRSDRQLDGYLADTDPPIAAHPAEAACDPITSFILVAANGYAEDIALVAARLSSDPDLWGYLAKTSSSSDWLHAAAASGHVDRVFFLCNVGVPLEATCHAGDLCAAGHTDVATFLLHRGAKLYARDGSELGITALEHAVMKHDCPTVSMLLDHVDDVNSPIFSRRLHFHLGNLMRFEIRDDTSAVAALLLERGLLVNVPVLEDGDKALGGNEEEDDAKTEPELPEDKDFTLLHFAAEMGNVEMMRQLLKHGADVNARTSIGITPLLLASGYKIHYSDWCAVHEVTRIEPRPQTVKLLLEAGADLTTATRHSECPLTYALRLQSKWGRTQPFKRWMEAVIDLLRAAARNNISVVPAAALQQPAGGYYSVAPAAALQPPARCCTSHGSFLGPKMTCSCAPTCNCI